MGDDTNIIIFDTESEDIELTTKSELEIFYEKLKKNKKLHPRFIDIFYQLTQQEKDKIYIESTIDTIVIEQLLLHYQAHIIPIIESIPNIDIKTEKVTFFSVQNKKQDNKKILKNLVSSESKNIKVLLRLKDDTICRFNDDFIKISKNNDVEVIGLLIKINEDVPFNKNIDEFITGSFSTYDILDKGIGTAIKIYCKQNVKKISITNKQSQATENETHLFYILMFDNIKNELSYIKKKTKNITNFSNESDLLLYKLLSKYLKNNIEINRSNKNNVQKIPYMIHKLDNTREMEKLIKDNISYINEFTSLIKILNIGYFDTYNKIQIKSKQKDNIVKNLEYKIRFENLKDEQNFQKFKRQMQLFQKSNIAYKKFKIHNLSALSEKEKEIVDNEYKKIITYKSKIDKMDLDIIHELYYIIDKKLDGSDETEKNTKLKKTLESVYSIITTKSVSFDKELYTQKVNTFLKDKNGNNLVCPHIIDKAIMLLKPYNDILEMNNSLQNNMMKYYSTISEDGYFCKICGELLTKDINQDEDLSIVTQQEYSTGKLDNDYDTLYAIIYREVIYILTTFISFIKSDTISLTTIVKNITHLIKSEIRAVEKNLLQVKTAQHDNIYLTLNIYMYVYIFAALCQLIYTNPNTISFKANFIKSGSGIFNKKNKARSSKNISTKEKKSNKKGSEKSIFIEYEHKKKGGDAIENKINDKVEKSIEKKAKNTKSNKADLQKIINDGLFIVKTIKRDDIIKSDFLTEDSIKILFLKAYRWVININYVSISNTYLNFFIQNDVINYLLYGYNQNIYKQYSGKTPEYEKIKDALPYIYNYDIPFYMINKKNDLYKNIKLILGRDYDTIEKEIKENIGIFDTIVAPKQWNDNKYTNDSLKMILDYIPLVTEDIKTNDKLEEHYKKYTHLKKLDNELKRSFIKRYLRPFMSIKIIVSPFVSYNKECVCEEYDLYFQKTTKKGQLSGEKKKITAKEIQNWLNDKDYKMVKEFQEWKLIEKKCSKCRTKIKTSPIDIFYNYYEIICPLGELHEFLEEKCSKCGMTHSIFESRDKSYYDKYKINYDTIRKKEREIINAELIKQKNTRKDLVKKSSPNEKIEKWVINNTKTIELIKLLGLSENIILNLGLYEKNPYDDIKNGLLNLKDITNEEIIKRNNNLYDYYLFIIRKYYLLKNSETSTIIHPYLKDLLLKFGNKNLYTKLPVINRNFIMIYKAYKKTLKSNELSNFLMFSISDTLLNIYNSFKNIQLEEMGKAFISTLFTSILDFEKKLTTFRPLRIKLKNAIEDTNPILQDEEQKTDDYDEAPDQTISQDLEYTDEIKDEEIEDPFALNDIDIEIEDPDDMDGIIKDVSDKL